MKKKSLSHYLDLMKSALDKQKYNQAKRYGEIVLKNLSYLSCSPFEEYLLYTRLGHAYMYLAEYSHSINVLYKASLISSKHNLAPEYIAHASFMIGYNCLFIKNPDQALAQFQKVEKYYQKQSDDFFPMDKTRYYNTLINMGYCYLSKSDIEKVRGIIEDKLMPNLSLLSDKSNLANYYHLQAEYFMELKEYKNARQSFQECINFMSQIKFFKGELDAKIYLSLIDILDGQLDPAIYNLRFLLKETHRQNFKDLFCKAGLLLSKCYALKNMPSKSAFMEKRIKPLLSKLDITWFYETAREFEQIHRQLEPMYQNKPAPIPIILKHTINRHYDTANYKHAIIGQSTPMIKVYQLIEKIAPTDLPVLIQGETGTGKELVARAIHNNSLRKEKMWLATNCGSLSGTLLENELFGHVKGAFTDAHQDKKGYIELASDGTLFLDEISEMSPAMQQKLLRVMDEKLVWRVGSEKPIQIDTRFIFASNKNIEELVKAKKFREDLYYRINTIIIAIPPLRDRKDDIPLLVDHFFEKYSSQNRSSSFVSRLSSEALSPFVNYPWPGNIRELENEIKRICALYPNTKQITETIISENIRNYKTTLDLGLTSFKEARKLAEKNLIINSIKKSKGNITQSARLLGCDRRYLYRKITQLKINTNTIFVTKS